MSVITKEDIFPVLDKLALGRVMVVGDLAIDEMIYGEASRISREAPVLILKHKERKILLGGASNAANNISALGAKKVSVFGACGSDFYAGKLKDAFSKVNINTDGIVEDPTRPTSTKTRISAASTQSVTQQIVRIDRESNEPINAEIEEKLLNKIDKAAKEHDAMLLSDYNIGVITPKIIEEASKIALSNNLILAVDAQIDLTRFKNTTIMTPNQPEAERTLGYSLPNTESVINGGFNLLKNTGSKMMLITRGSEGMMLFEPNNTITSIPAFNKTDVFDVTGAGDTVVGSLLLSLAVGIEPKIASVIGNLAASIVVREFGAAVTNIDELKYNLEKLKIKELAVSSII